MNAVITPEEKNECLKVRFNTGKKSRWHQSQNCGGTDSRNFSLPFYILTARESHPSIFPNRCHELPSNWADGVPMRGCSISQKCLIAMLGFQNWLTVSSRAKAF